MVTFGNMNKIWRYGIASIEKAFLISLICSYKNTRHFCVSEITGGC